MSVVRLGSFPLSFPLSEEFSNANCLAAVNDINFQKTRQCSRLKSPNSEYCSVHQKSRKVGQFNSEGKFTKPLREEKSSQIEVNIATSDVIKDIYVQLDISYRKQLEDYLLRWAEFIGDLQRRKIGLTKEVVDLEQVQQELQTKLEDNKAQIERVRGAITEEAFNPEISSSEETINTLEEQNAGLTQQINDLETQLQQSRISTEFCTRTLRDMVYVNQQQFSRFRVLSEGTIRELEQQAVQPLERSEQPPRIPEEQPQAMPQAMPQAIPQANPPLESKRRKSILGKKPREEPVELEEQQRRTQKELEQQERAAQAAESERNRVAAESARQFLLAEMRAKGGLYLVVRIKCQLTKVTTTNLISKLAQDEINFKMPGLRKTIKHKNLHVFDDNTESKTCTKNRLTFGQTLLSDRSKLLATLNPKPSLDVLASHETWFQNKKDLILKSAESNLLTETKVQEEDNKSPLRKEFELKKLPQTDLVRVESIEETYFKMESMTQKIGEEFILNSPLKILDLSDKMPSKITIFAIGVSGSGKTTSARAIFKNLILDFTKKLPANASATMSIGIMEVYSIKTSPSEQKYRIMKRNLRPRPNPTTSEDLPFLQLESSKKIKKIKGAAKGAQEAGAAEGAQEAGAAEGAQEAGAAEGAQEVGAAEGAQVEAAEGAQEVEAAEGAQEASQEVKSVDENEIDYHSEVVPAADRVKFVADVLNHDLLTEKQRLIRYTPDNEAGSSRSIKILSVKIKTADNNYIINLIDTAGYEFYGQPALLTTHFKDLLIKKRNLNNNFIAENEINKEAELMKNSTLREGNFIRDSLTYAQSYLKHTFGQQQDVEPRQGNPKKAFQKEADVTGDVTWLNKFISAEDLTVVLGTLKSAPTETESVKEMYNFIDAILPVTKS